MNFNILFAFFVFIVFCSCDRSGQYPKMILEQNLTKQYDKAKWFLYYRLCKAKCETGYGGQHRKKHLIKDSKYLSSYEIIFDTVYVNKDSLEFCFYFKVSDSLNCITFNGDGEFYFNPRIGFIGDSIKYISYGNERWTYHDINLETARDEELEKFIKAHQSELYPWFNKEAKKRGLLEN